MTRPIDLSVVEYLKQVSGVMPKRPGHKFSSFEDFYLKTGHLYPHERYTKAEKVEIHAGIFRSGVEPAIKQCFYNAQQLALSGGFGYAEGYAFPDDIPIAVHHAWAVYHGKPVDVTLRRDGDGAAGDPVKLLERASFNLSHVAYYGVEFPKDLIWKVWQEERTARPMIDDWKHGFPLLRNPRKAR